MEIREEDLIHKEWRSTGTTWTNYELFEKKGYFVIKNLCDPKTLIEDGLELTIKNFLNN